MSRYLNLPDTSSSKEKTVRYIPWWTSICIKKYVSCSNINQINNKSDNAVQFNSVVHSCLTLCKPLDYSRPVFPVHHQFPEFTQTHVHWVGDAIQPSQPLLSPSPPMLIIPNIRDFFNESVFRIRWPKYWSFSFSICSSNEYSGLISFRMDWLDLLAVQGTLKSLSMAHFKNINSSVLRFHYSRTHIHTWQLEKP